MNSGVRSVHDQVSNLAPGIVGARSITDQPTSVGKFAPIIDRRYSMASRKCHNLIDVAAKQRIRADEQCTQFPIGNGKKGFV